jgi:hypothetical protein
MNDKNTIRVQLIFRVVLALLSCLFVFQYNKYNGYIHANESLLLTEDAFDFSGWEMMAFIVPLLGLVLVFFTSKIHPMVLIAVSELLLIASFAWVCAAILVWAYASRPGFAWNHWLNYYHSP